MVLTVIGEGGRQGGGLTCKAPMLSYDGAITRGVQLPGLQHGKSQVCTCRSIALARKSPLVTHTTNLPIQALKNASYDGPQTQRCCSCVAVQKIADTSFHTAC